MCSPILFTAVQQHDLVGQRHGLHLVVRHVDHAGGTDALVKGGNLQPGLRAGRNLPDKEFRYLRTVIVTAAVYWGFNSYLRVTAKHSS